CGWYPRKFGLVHVVEALVKKLREQDVQNVPDSTITSVQQRGGRIHGLTVKTGQRETTLESISALYWTAGWPGLAELLCSPLHMHRDSRRQAAHLHLRFHRPIETRELYNFYVFA